MSSCRRSVPPIVTSVVNPSQLFAPRFATCERTTVSSSQYQQEVLLGDPLSLAIMGAAPSTAQSVPCNTITESNSSLLVDVTMYDDASSFIKVPNNSELLSTHTSHQPAQTCKGYPGVTFVKTLLNVQISSLKYFITK